MGHADLLLITPVPPLPILSLILIHYIPVCWFWSFIALVAARAMDSISARTAARVPTCCPLFAAGFPAPRIAAAASAAVCRARSLPPYLGAQGWSLQEFM